jgi:hypothetical protein
MTTTTTTNKNDEIYSMVPQIYDYLSVQGLNTKFGLNSTDFEIFIIKELMGGEGGDYSIKKEENYSTITTPVMKGWIAQ